MHRLALALALAATAVLAAPRPADACGNSVRRVVDTSNIALRNAEVLLAEGHYKKAISAVREHFGDRALASGWDARADLQRRAQRVLALAVVRSKGALPIGKDLGGKTDGQRQAAVAWAVLTLRVQRRAIDDTDVACILDPQKCTTGEGDPVKTAELAEALALQATGRAEAWGLLKDLADRDLMPGAAGWALLGELGRERGDLETSKKAVERCKQIAADGVQCDTSENS